MQAEVRYVADCANIVGEVPVWDVDEQALYWVDIEGRRLHRLEPATGRIDIWDMPERIASFALRQSGGLVVAFASGIAFFDPVTGRVEWIARPEAHLPSNRFNEGKVDRKGRFWIGSMDDGLAGSTGSLYRLDPDLRRTGASTAKSGCRLPNLRAACSAVPGSARSMSPAPSGTRPPLR